MGSSHPKYFLENFNDVTVSGWRKHLTPKMTADVVKPTLKDSRYYNDTGVNHHKRRIWPEWTRDAIRDDVTWKRATKKKTALKNIKFYLFFILFTRKVRLKSYKSELCSH